MRRIRVLPGLVTRGRETARNATCCAGSGDMPATCHRKQDNKQTTTATRTGIGCERGMTTTSARHEHEMKTADGRRQPSAGVGRLVRRLERERRTWTRRPDRRPGGGHRGGVAGGCGRGVAVGAGGDPAGGLTWPARDGSQAARRSGAAGEPAGVVPVRRVLGRPAGRRRRPRRSRAGRRRTPSRRLARAQPAALDDRRPPTRSAPGCGAASRSCASCPPGEAVRAGADREGLEALTGRR